MTEAGALVNRHAMGLADDVLAFIAEHRDCRGGLDYRSPEDRSRIVLVCETCGAVLDRSIDDP